MHASPAELHRTAGDRLESDGQRYTSNRRALVEALATAERPVSVIELLELTKGLAQSSAYRNLSVLEDAGVVHRFVTSDDTARYELSEDLTGHHHHLICSKCGDVVDIDVPASLEEGVGELAASVGAAHGFTIEHHQLDLVGTCSGCSSATR
jgi:Fur family ferric uptake transcriptional regulator